jgi:hypothetical protein
MLYSTSPYPVQIVSKLEDILASQDQREIDQFINAYRAGKIEPEKQSEKPLVVWQPYNVNEKRILAALQSKPLDIGEKEIKNWAEIAVHQAVEIFRNQLSYQTFDSLYFPEDSTRFPLHSFKTIVRRKAIHQGILAFEYVEKKNGFSCVEGEEWHPDEVNIYPVRELQAHKVLRSRGIKVLTVGISDLEPANSSVKKYMFENWRASWEQERLITLADYNLQVERLHNQKIVSATQDSIYAMGEILESESKIDAILTDQILNTVLDLANDSDYRSLLPSELIDMVPFLQKYLPAYIDDQA